MSIFTGLFSGLLVFCLKISGVSAFPPPLDPETEREYFIRARNGDGDARSKLIVHNLRLVAHIVRKYYPTSDNRDDLMSIGTIGLIKAIDSFKIENGARFATYATRCLQNEILMHFRSQKKRMGDVSLSETIDTDREGNPLTYIDIISCDDTIAEDLDLKFNTKRVIELIGTRLDERERQIIVARYGLGGRPPVTQRELAEILGISRSYVSRIEKSALEKLREEL